MPWGAVAGAVVGGYAANKAAGKAADSANRNADNAIEAGKPWNTKGSFGEARFDEDTKTINMNLAQPWQSEYDLAMANAAKQRDYISSIENDPMAAGKKFYDMNKALYAKDDEDQRLALENRLYGQGMFGSKGGAGQMGSLYDAQLRRDEEAKVAALNQAQGYVDLYRKRSTEDLAAAESIGGLTSGYAQTGQGIGTTQGNLAMNAANMKTNAAVGMGAVNSNAWAGVGKSIGKADWSGMFNSNNNANTTYVPGGSYTGSTADTAVWNP